jgi:hypothetical protein
LVGGVVFLVVSVIVLDVSVVDLAVSVVVVAGAVVAVESVLVLSEPPAFSAELQPVATAPIIVAAIASVKICFFISILNKV